MSSLESNNRVSLPAWLGRGLTAVKASVRWATGKGLTDRLRAQTMPYNTLPPGTHRIYGSTCHQRVVPIYGDPEALFRLLTPGNSLFFKNCFYSGREIRTHDQRPIHDLSTTPFVKALVRWAAGTKVNRSPTQTKPYNTLSGGKREGRDAIDLSQGRCDV